MACLRRSCWRRKPARYFSIMDSREIKEIDKSEAEFEDDLEKFRNEL